MAGLLCPCRCGRACRLPEPSTRDGGQLGKGTRARHKMFGRCACVCGFRAPYCGFARACCTTVFYCGSVGCYKAGGPLRSVRSRIGSIPCQIRSLHLLALACLSAHLDSVTPPERAPRDDDSWDLAACRNVKFAPFHVSSSIHIATLEFYHNYF